MKIKSLVFTFENCERIEVDGKYIGDFLIDDIHTSICRQAINWIDELIVADTIVIELHKDANKKHAPFGDNYKTTVFNRIKLYDDITYIDFTLVDQYAETDEEKVEKSYSYGVNWCKDNDYENSYQKVFISKCGNLYLVINKNTDIKDYFDIEEINDDEAMDFRFDMYDVGDKYSNPDRYNEEIKDEF